MYEEDPLSWAELLGDAPQVGLTFGYVQKAPTPTTVAPAKTRTFQKAPAPPPPPPPPKAKPQPQMMAAPKSSPAPMAKSISHAMAPLSKKLDPKKMFPQGPKDPKGPGPYGLQTPEVPKEMQPPDMGGGGGGGGPPPAPPPPPPELPPEPPPEMADTGVPDEMVPGWEGAWDEKAAPDASDELPGLPRQDASEAPQSGGMGWKLAAGALAAVALYHFSR